MFPEQNQNYLDGQNRDIWIHLILRKAFDDIDLDVYYLPNPCIGNTYLARTFDLCTRSKNDQLDFLSRIVYNIKLNIKNRFTGPRFGILKRGSTYFILDKYILCMFHSHFGVLATEDDVTATKMFRYKRYRSRMVQRIKQQLI